MSLSFTGTGNSLSEVEIKIQGIALPICLVNNQSNIVNLNSSFEQWAGVVTASSIKGKNFNQLFYNVTSPRQINSHQSIVSPVATYKSPRCETIVVTPLEASITPAYSIILVNQMSSHNKHAACPEKYIAPTDLGIIASSIAHELNNPLAGILTFLHLIKKEIDLSDPRRPKIEAIVMTALKCQEKIERLLIDARPQL